MHAAAQFNTLQPVRQMNSVRSIRPSSRRATASPFLARVAARACAASARRVTVPRLIERWPAQDVVPVGTHVLDAPGCRRSAGATSGRLARPAHVQLGFAEVADARREARKPSRHQAKTTVAGRAGVVLLDPQVGLVVQPSSVRWNRADADIHHAGAERRVLVGEIWV